jgi:hypothetical protein
MSKDCEGPMGQVGYFYLGFFEIVQIFRRIAQVTPRPLSQQRFSEARDAFSAHIKIKILSKTSIYKTMPVSLYLYKIQHIDYVTKSHR